MTNHLVARGGELNIQAKAAKSRGTVIQVEK